MRTRHLLSALALATLASVATPVFAGPVSPDSEAGQTRLELRLPSFSAWLGVDWPALLGWLALGTETPPEPPPDRPAEGTITDPNG